MFTPAIIEDIKLVQKAQMQYQTGFETIIKKVVREDEERKLEAHKKAVQAKKDKERQVIKEQRERAEKARQEQIKKEQDEANRKAVQEAKKQAEQIEEEQPSQEAESEVPVGEQPSSSGGIGSTWAEVSPEQAATYMEQGTGVPASRWLSIIYHESTNNPTVTNSIGCFGFLQLHPVHGAVSQMTPQQYLDTAIGVYQSQGLAAWEVVTMGKA